MLLEEKNDLRGTHMYAAQPLWGDEILAPTGMTGDDLLRLPDDGAKNELYEGILVRETMTSLEHGGLCHWLSGLLVIYARQTGFANSVVQNALFDFTLPGAPRRTILAPDLAILRRKMHLPPNVATVIPLIAVEVLSSSQTMAEMRLKARFYRNVGVDEVWIINPNDQTIEVWAGQGQTTFADPQPVTTTLLPGFSFTYTDLLG
jgi:Uma2 family endonuclease